ncbi:MAG: hypothetical protein IKZ60_08955 [Bacteroidales bacterium]|nr:hypothetical protein [Bacteroidales bacterium]
MKRIITLLILLAAFCTHAAAQDLITLRDGTEIIAKVLEVNLQDVRYKKFSNLDGPIYTEAKRNILMIEYSNGEKDVFTQIQQQPLLQIPDSGRAIPEGITAGMAYRDYQHLYSARQYNRLEPEYYSPTAAAVCSYFIPGLGQIICGETVRGLCIGAAAIGCMACSAGSGEFSNETGVIFGIAAIGLWAWGIYDAQKVAKIKNMYLNDSQSRRKVSLSAGPLSLKLTF